MKKIIHVIFSLVLLILIYQFINTPSCKIEEIKSLISIILPDVKNISISEGNNSFTRNKEQIYICTKDENGEYYSNNMLIHVTIHELSHILCNEYDTTDYHSNAFYKIYNDLLKKAIKAKIYDPSIPKVQNYCNY
jgi:hypothetical protein